MKREQKTKTKPQTGRRRLDQLVGRTYFTMILHPFYGWIRVGRQYGSREVAQSWIPFVRKAWRGCKAKVETFRYKTVNGELTEESRRLLAKRYNIDVPNPSHHDGAASAPSVDGVVQITKSGKTK